MAENKEFVIVGTAKWVEGLEKWAKNRQYEQVKSRGATGKST